MSEFGATLSPTEVRFERLLPGPIEMVWEFLVDSRKRGEWFASGPMERRVGGKVKLRFKHSELSPHAALPPERYKEMDATGHDSEGEVTAFDPPRRLAFLWGSSEVVFDLEPKGDRVLLVLTHRRLSGRGEQVDVLGGWHTHLAILVERANGRTPRAFWDLFREIDGTYEERVPR
ncbi:MAG: SRPBCC family protein [Enhydrobacter sp.]|nr:MAG: SRPBCC family protein [Enhydrobacter sp.]